MGTRVLLLVGTRKGAFILESDAERKDWVTRGPFCANWPINHVIADPATGAIYAGGGGPWFGPGVWKTEDLGESWSHSNAGLQAAEGAEPVKAVWSLNTAHGVLHTGVEPAALYRSHDDGATFEAVDGLQQHPSRPKWMAGAGGMILHSLVPHPDDPEQFWVAISAAGVFYTADDGKTWEARNRNTRADFLPEGQNYPEFGQCVHCLIMAPGRPDRLYQQNHCGMYRCDDGAANWESIEDGLPTSFGFPAAVHPRDADTLYLMPLTPPEAGRYMPDGKAAVWRTRDAGQSWEALTSGLPAENAFFGVLRQALATDRLEPAGVYFGTNGGELYGSADEGESWSCIAAHLPVIHSVETYVID